MIMININNIDNNYKITNTPFSQDNNYEAFVENTSNQSKDSFVLHHQNGIVGINFVSISNVELVYIEHRNTQAITFLTDGTAVIIKGYKLEKLFDMLFKWRVKAIFLCQDKQIIANPENNTIITEIVVDHCDTRRNVLPSDNHSNNTD